MRCNHDGAIMSERVAPERKRSGRPLDFSRDLPGSRIEGRVQPAFAAVAEAFVQGFTERGEVGASLCIHRGDDVVLDLWGGIADPAAQRPWEEDTVSVVFSCTKGATALCAHVLEASGLLKLGDRVTRLWPAFGQAGKSETTLQMVLDHTAGVPVLREPLKPDALEDPNYLLELLERESPFWKPGERHGYHAITFGLIVAELVGRSTGLSLGRFFDQAIARPLGLDFWIGLPQAIEPRVAPLIMPSTRRQPMTPFLRAATTEPASIPHLFVNNSGDWARRGVNTRSGRAVEIGSANGVTNARGLAGLYAPLQRGGAIGGVGLARMVERVGANARRQPPAPDATLRMPTRFNDGFMFGVDNRSLLPEGHSLLIGTEAFGHCGSGGSIGFVDPAAGISFGYTMNRMGIGVLLNDRAHALVQATYQALRL
jgi:CubicO group peptidase (beta-lactamase class C family)